jgi:hypothetical protein
LDNSNDREDDCVLDNESEIELNNGIENWECPAQQNVSACKDAYASVRRYMDMVADVDLSDYVCRGVEVKVGLSREI